MYCKNCGAENPDGAKFCGECGQKFSNIVIKSEKSMLVALVISFFLPGLGIVYAGNVKKGMVLFIVGFVFNFLGIGIAICSIVGILVWAYSLYCTYNEVKIANGISNPNLIEDLKSQEGSKKVVGIVVILIIVLIVLSGISVALTRNAYDGHHSADYKPTSNSGGSHVSSNPSSSSSGSNSYSSSSNGHDVSSHYEGEYGSADTNGRIYDDGSIEAHQKGTTDYGDYQVDSYMDSSGNLHGTVDVGGRTYHVSN